MKIRFNSIDLPLKDHIVELSYYNHNYYKNDNTTTDEYNFFDNDVVLLVTEDDCNEGIAYFGKLSGNKVFIPAFALSFDASY